MIEPKKHIKDLFRMKPPHEDRIGKVHRFDRNEKTTPFPEDHLKKILADIHPDELIAYPQLEPLYEKISTWLKVDRDEVLLCSGSDTGIKSIFEVYVEDGDDVVMLSPTYGMYNVYCKMYGANAVEITYAPDLSLDVQSILDAINDNTKLVALANPNHTGTVIAQEDMVRIIEKAYNHNALVLIDEAYYHFSKETMISFINDYENLIIVRTFSKAFGIAPLRVGYVVADSDIIEELYKVKLTHEVTAFGARVASYMIDNLEILEGYVNDVNEAKDVLYNRLSDLDFEVLKSEANFVYFKPPQAVDGKQLMEALQKENIFLKGPFDKTPFSGHIRITVGTAEQSKMFCEAVEKNIKPALA